MSKYKILAITLARGGSKGIKNKNIKKISGKPLIFYTIKEALKSNLISDYIVSTDSQDISNISKKLGAKVPFLRPKKYSTDKASSVSALKHAVIWMENEHNIKYDFVIELMCTNPLKTKSDIESVIKKLIKTKADSVIAVNKLEDHHPRRIKKIVNDKIVDFCLNEKKESRRQDLKPDAYIRSGSIYGMKRDYLIKKNRRYGGNNSRPYVLDSKKAINIDSNIDFVIAKEILKK
jgi:CMP-N-acetylneuraminic acid synthetase